MAYKFSLEIFLYVLQEQCTQCAKKSGNFPSNFALSFLLIYFHNSYNEFEFFSGNCPIKALLNITNKKILTMQVEKVFGGVLSFFFFLYTLQVLDCNRIVTKCSWLKLFKQMGTMFLSKAT